MRPWCLYPVILGVLLPLAAFAAPKAVLNGPATVGLNQPAVYKTTGSVGKSFKWVVIPEDIEAAAIPIILDNGDGTTDRGLIVIPPRVTQFWVLFLAVEGDQLSIGRIAVNTGVVPPDPVKPDPVKPDPVTPIPPDPVKPDPVKPDPNKNQWATWAANTAKTSVTLPDADRVATAKKLGNAMLNACKLCKDGSVTDTKEARNILAKQTFDAMTAEERKAWLAWSTALNAEIKKTVDAGNLKTVQDFVNVWASVAEGLLGLGGGS